MKQNDQTMVLFNKSTSGHQDSYWFFRSFIAFSLLSKLLIISSIIIIK